MVEQSKEEAMEQFRKDEARVKSKIRTTRRIQNVVWLISASLALGFFAYIGYAHHKLGMDLAALADKMLPLLTGIIIAVTAGYTIFIFLYSAIVRQIYKSFSIHHPRLNARLHPDEQIRLVWHRYLRSDPDNSSHNSAFLPVMMIIIKIAALFILIIGSQYGWMQLMEIAGKELQTGDYAFLGLIDLTLFSSIVLFAVVLLAVRIGVLGKRNKEHQKARESHPPADPGRAR